MLHVFIQQNLHKEPSK